MNALILRNVQIIDPSSQAHLKNRDILIRDGKIAAIADSIKGEGDEKVLEGNEWKVSPGWMDFRANFRDPGFEYKEDLRSGANAAAAGGFTAVALLPDTDPILQSKSEVEYIRSVSSKLPVELYPLGALTRDLAGEEITEMYDMHCSGAVAFSNGNKSLKAGTMQRALLYTQGFGGLVCEHAQDTSLSAGGQMHEGYHSTLLGMKGIPAHAESIVVSRDLELLRYTGGRLHFSHISTAESVELIRKARKEGLQVSCDVAAHQLLLNDSMLEEYDSAFKVNPPLRSEEHRKALLEGVLDGTIEVVVSDHHPEDVEHKQVEFEYAAAGINALQTTFPVLAEALPELKDERLYELLCMGPRQLAGLAVPRIAEGEPANLTVYSRKESWEFSRSGNKSKSPFSPFMDRSFASRVIGVYSKNQWIPA